MPPTPNPKSLALYRRILRASRRLEPDAREHYRRFARSGFIGHADEQDDDRIDEIIERVEHDVDWILRKYTGKGLHEQP
ncbi:hypothetical protein PINS_up010794 [Pythium insidiosum]|nr:hypothetical protein PINS_up010794 [Pythium insidiosum]